MHVLYFHQHFSTPQGAAGIRSYEMARHLIERGHSVTMVCGSYGTGNTGLSGEPKNGIRRGIVEGINVIEICLPYSNYLSFLKRAQVFLTFALKATAIALREKYDLLFATSTPLTIAIPGIIAKLFRRKPFVFEVRDLWPELPKEMGVIKNPFILWTLGALEWAAYKCADALIGLSPGMKTGIELRGIPSSSVTMIPNGCDTTLFAPSEEKNIKLPELSPSDFHAVFTGAHGIANGLDAVLDMAHVLQQQEKGNIKIVFIGEGKCKPALQERVKNEGLRNCIFLNSIPKLELAKLLPQFNLGLMILANVPAFYYGTSPNKFFDYLSAGLPTVNNYPGWVADMLKEHQCGIGVSPDNPQAFAQAIIQLAENQELSKRFSKNARKLAKKKFDRKKLADQFVDWLENTVKTKTSLPSETPEPPYEPEVPLDEVGGKGM